jgi:hypothetical protein
LNAQPDKQAIFQRLQHSLQALALPAAAQIALFPDFVCKTDELVLDFDHWRSCAVGNYRVEMTPAQLQSLAAVDTHIDIPNIDEYKSVWDESALYSHPFWEELRDLAIQSLNAFGWPQETPPSYAHEFVPGRRQ